MLQDTLDKKFGGFVTVELIRDGKNGPDVMSRETVSNLVVNTGKEQLLRLSGGLQSNIFDNFRIGTSGAAVASNQTNILASVAGSLRVADSISLLSGTRTLRMIISYPSGTGGSTAISAAGIDEVVIRNTLTTGGLSLMRAIFTAVNKTKADKLKITYQLRVT
jgi:hypothetical protein